MKIRLGKVILKFITAIIGLFTTCNARPSTVIPATPF